MMDLIERNVLLAELRMSCKWHAENSRELSLLQRDINIVMEQPGIDAEPVRHGKWWRYPLEQLGFPEHVYMMRQCSECKKVFDQKWNYCPNCGAKMNNVKEKDEETEIWHSLKGNVEAPKGTFDKIYEDEDV